MEYPAEFLAENVGERGHVAGFPAFFLWDRSARSWHDRLDHLGPEFAMVADTMPDGNAAWIHLSAHDHVWTSTARFIGVNVKYMFYIPDRDSHFEPPPGYRLMAQAPHPLGSKLLQYEGHKLWERRRLRERRYTMRVYERPADETLTWSD
jgi:hypothetical protein